ncbi:MAG: hypothetical protein SFX72_04105 [Isosphaeraceae bacterium]|nr:hypothetical protein [Isosphaeraceae bacterium]
MSTSRSQPDAREVERIEVLAVVDDPGLVDQFLEYAVPGSLWTAHIRTADVSAELVARKPLGLTSERECLFLSLKLVLPVPVEPGLRIRLSAWEWPGLKVSGVIRPWGG